MEVLCLYIEHFPVDVESLDQPDLAGKPIIIGGYAHERKSVFDCSPEAMRFGIRIGMPLREAQHLCSDAIFIPCDQAKYLQRLEKVLGTLDQFSPIVEPDGLGRAFLDASRLEELFCPPQELATVISREVAVQTGLHANIGIASSIFVASVAADLASVDRPLVVSKGREREFLSPLPAELLPISEETKRRLKVLGLRTIGQIASLPLHASEAQFGGEGLLASKLANGIDDRPLTPRAKPALLVEELSDENLLETVGDS